MKKDERDEIRRNSGDMRVYKLQKHLLKALDYLDILEAENERLKVALQFYAEEENWEDGGTKGDGKYIVTTCSPADGDVGQRARDALQGRS